MMINKRLIGAVRESKKYIVANVALQWCSLAANIIMIGTICRLLERLYLKCAEETDLLLTAFITIMAVILRFLCNVCAARMGFLSSNTGFPPGIYNAYRQQGLFCGSWGDELMNAQSKREQEKPDDCPILPEKTRWKGSLSRLRRFEHLRPAAQRQVPLHGDKNLLLQL